MKVGCKVTAGLMAAMLSHIRRSRRCGKVQAGSPTALKVRGRQQSNNIYCGAARRGTMKLTSIKLLLASSFHNEPRRLVCNEGQEEVLCSDCSEAPRVRGSGAPGLRGSEAHQMQSFTRCKIIWT